MNMMKQELPNDYNLFDITGTYFWCPERKFDDSVMVSVNTNISCMNKLLVSNKARKSNLAYNTALHRVVINLTVLLLGVITCLAITLIKN